MIEKILVDISEVIYYSNKSHILKSNQIITFMISSKYNKLLQEIPDDIKKLIISNIERNNWKETKHILKK